MRRRRHGKTLALGPVLVAVSLLAACDTNDGRDMQAPSSYEQWVLENTTPSTSSTTTTIAPPTTLAATSSSAALAATAVESTSAADTAGTTDAGTAAGGTAAGGTAAGGTAAGGSLPAETFAESLGLANLAEAGVEFIGPWPTDAAIPVEYTCNGEENAPLLTWTAPPEGTVEVALVVTDETADGFAHWIIIGMPPEAGSVGGPEPVVVGTEATNSTGAVGWAGPCPPDAGAHVYRFTLYALSQAVELPPEAAPGDLIQAIEASATGAASFTGTYQVA